MASNGPSKFVLPIILLVIGLGIGFFMAPKPKISEAEFYELEDNYQQLLSEKTVLLKDIEDLEDKGEQVRIDLVEERKKYDELLLEWNDLVDDWNNLIDVWDELVDDYNGLSDNYTRSYYIEFNWNETFDEPILNKKVPSIGQVYDWLRLDKTDKLDYTDNYDCSQYAATLCLNAKQMDWDMGIITAFGNYTQGEGYAHAFNALITKDGLVYIEPQTDEVWWLNDYQPLTVNDTANLNGDLVRVSDINIIAKYD